MSKQKMRNTKNRHGGYFKTQNPVGQTSREESRQWDGRPFQATPWLPVRAAQIPAPLSKSILKENK